MKRLIQKPINGWIFALICALVLTTGCKTRLIDYTLISSKNVDLSKISTFRRGTERATGKDELYLILFIPTKPQVSVKEALDQAIQSVPGAVALTDGVIYYENYTFILGAYSAYVVEGTPLIDPALQGAQRPVKTRYLIGTMDSNTRLSTYQSVDEPTFEAAKQYIKTKDKKALEKIIHPNT